MFDIDCNTVPCTNNGNEGTNNKLNSVFPTHPQFYTFCGLVHEQLMFSNNRIDAILDGSVRPNPSRLYVELKEEREAAKDLLRQRMNSTHATNAFILEELSTFMGKIGALSAKVGELKFTSDFGAGQEEQSQSQKKKGRGPKSLGGRLISRPIPKKNQTKSHETPAHLKEPIELSTFSDQDSLLRHVEERGIQVERLGTVPSNGDCWYESIFNIMNHNSLYRDGIQDALDLRKAIVKSINSSHPLFDTWLVICFRGRLALMNAFKRLHSNSGVFTDNDGIINIATAYYLHTDIHIVGTSNTDQSPFTQISCGAEHSELPFWVGYYQDTTDLNDGERRSGHYVSLTPKGADSVRLDHTIFDDTCPALEQEVKILEMFSTETMMVNLSLKRLLEIDLAPSQLSSSRIVSILQFQISSFYSESSSNGELARIILAKFQGILSGTKNRSVNLTGADLQEQERVLSFQVFLFTSITMKFQPSSDNLFIYRHFSPLPFEYFSHIFLSQLT